MNIQPVTCIEEDPSNIEDAYERGKESVIDIRLTKEFSKNIETTSKYSNQIYR